MFKSILSIICFLGISFTQIQYGGSPKFYDDRTLDVSFIAVDQSQHINRSSHPMVFQFGNEYSYEYNILENASSIINDNEITYIFGIESRGAFGIGLYFDQFVLSQNSKLFIYDEDQSFFMGSFDSRNNKAQMELTTSLVKSDRIIIELTVPENEAEEVLLNVNTVIHDFTDIRNYYDTAQNDREDCNLNVIKM